MLYRLIIEFQVAVSCHTYNILFLNVQELIRQREQLERTEMRLDEINNTLRFSQKRIQGIKVKFNIHFLHLSSSVIKCSLSEYT